METHTITRQKGPISGLAPQPPDSLPTGSERKKGPFWGRTEAYLIDSLERIRYSVIKEESERVVKTLACQPRAGAGSSSFISVSR